MPAMVGIVIKAHLASPQVNLTYLVLGVEVCIFVRVFVRFRSWLCHPPTGNVNRGCDVRVP